MKTLVASLFAVAACAASSAWAAADAPSPMTAADPAFERTQAAIAKKDWTQAQALAREALDRNPANADFHNLYAYTVRMGANPAMDVVFKHYNEALRLDPEHRGAHEYLGEAYLMTGNLDKAKAQLKILDRLCFFSCEEFRMLRKAIADYEVKRGRN
jgi:tetratricopeptide (TPR) repeat protein